MISAPTDFVNALENGDRNYQLLIHADLVSGTTLTLTNAEIWSMGLSIEDSISTNADALEFGTAVIGQLMLTLNNIHDDFTQYDFTNADITVQLGLRTDESLPYSYMQRGVYRVIEMKGEGGLISLTCQDAMYHFDQTYPAVGIVFPSTALAVVQDACNSCGVTLGVSTFTGASTVIPAPPAEGVTYRAMLSWVGQMVGCSWKINADGELMPVWYDLDALADWYSSGTVPYEISQTAAASVALDDTYVTGIQIVVANEPSEDPDVQVDAFSVYTAGTDGYMIKIEGNPLINNTNAQAIANALYSQVSGMRFRKATITYMSDPRLESGDVAVLHDYKGNDYAILISTVQFVVGEYQASVSASETPARNSAERYGVGTQNTVRLFNAIQREMTEREDAIADLQEQLDEAPGLYMTTTTESGATVYILHNQPNLADSDVVWKMTSTAFGVSTNGGQSYNAGLTADGTVIAQRLYSETIVAGILQSDGYTYTSGVYSDTGMIVDLDNKVIRTPSFAVTPSGVLYAKDAVISGTITLGGANNVNGTLTILDASGQTIGHWDKDGILIENADSQSTFTIDDRVVQMTDREGNVFFECYDMRDENGYIEESFISTGSPGDTYTTIYTTFSIDTVAWVKANGSPVTYTVLSLTGIKITPALSPGTTVVVKYTVADSARTQCKVYTLGSRDPDEKIGAGSFASGVSTVASGRFSHVEGWESIASGAAAHAEGLGTIASGAYSHAEGGNWSEASGMYSHSEGLSIASGDTSHAEGYHTVASGAYSHSQNNYTIASSANQTAIGKYNVEDDNDIYAFIIGNGTGDSNRSNAFTVDWNGNVEAKGNFTSTNGTRSITLKVSGTVAGLYDDNQSNYMMYGSTGDTWLYLNKDDIYSSGIYCGTKILRTDGTLRVGTGTAPYTHVNKGSIEVYGTSSAISYVGVYGDGTGSGGQIYMQCETDGRVTLGSRGRNGTWYTILNRANNEHEISAHGEWRFDNSKWIYFNNSSGTRKGMLYMNSSNQFFCGYAGYTESFGASYFDGNVVYIRSKNNIECEGNFLFQDYTNTKRRPVASVSGDGSRVAYMQVDNNTRLAAFTQNGTAGSTISKRYWTVSTSDIRLKENIEDTNIIALPIINAIKMRAFDWKDADDHWDIGMIADEVEQVDSRLVYGGGYTEDGYMDTKSIDTFYLMGYLVKAVQELSAEIERMKAS